MSKQQPQEDNRKEEQEFIKKVSKPAFIQLLRENAEKYNLDLKEFNIDLEYMLIVVYREDGELNYDIIVQNDGYPISPDEDTDGFVYTWLRGYDENCEWIGDEDGDGGVCLVQVLAVDPQGNIDGSDEDGEDSRND